MSPQIFNQLFPAPPGNRRAGLYLVQVHTRNNPGGFVLRGRSTDKLEGSVVKTPEWLRRALRTNSGQVVRVAPVLGAARSIQFLTICGNYGSSLEMIIKKELRKLVIVNAYTQLHLVVGHDRILISIGKVLPVGALRVCTHGPGKTRIVFDDPQSDSMTDSSSDED